MRARRGVFMAVMGCVATTLSLGAVVLMAPGEALAVKLNGPLVAGGSVVDAQLTPDGSRVVYLADQDANERVELYSVPVTGGAATRLNGPLAVGGDVQGFQITPDGSRVVYLADQDANDRVELYSVPVAGGLPTKLSGFLQAVDDGGDVTSFQITSDGSHVVYLADQDTNDHVELYVVAIGGGPTPKLNDPIVLGASVTTFQIAPDDGRVVYRADQDTDEVFELYSVPLPGGTVTRLNPPLVEDGDIATGLAFEITPDSSRVVYRASQDTEGVTELYSVPIQGGAATKLNDTLPDDADVAAFRIAPAGGRVVYRVREDLPDNSERSEIYSVAVGGGPSTKLNGPLVALGNVTAFEITPSGSRVIYRADQDTDQVFELYSVPVAGGAATRLNPLLVLDGRVHSFQITPDSTRVLYLADQALDTVDELFSVPVAGGLATRLNPPLPSGRDVVAFAISPDGSHVFYLADQDRNGVNELYRVPLAGGQVTKLNAVLAATRAVHGFEIAPDGRRVVYLEGPDTATSQLPDPVFELHGTQVPTFTDVPAGHPFLTWIEALVEAGFTGGCGVDPPRFCPERIVTRAQMAVFLLRGIDGPGSTPPAATGTVFADVPVNGFAAAWIERLSALGITSGCASSPPLFCPDRGVTRGQTAVFLLRAKHGVGYNPPAVTGVFADVPVDHPFAAWIEQLHREGIAAGCGANPARFCPSTPVTRGQMAVFLGRTFNLPL